ncbi:MAG TPA: APC family permease [Clostridium sp.]
MKETNLKKDNLNVIETVALSVAIIAPTAAMSLNISLMAKTASFSSPLIFLISMIVVGFVSYSIIKFNQYLSNSGSLYAFTKEALGEKTGFTAGWALLLAYVMLAAGCTAELGSFFGKLLLTFGIHISWLPLALIFSLLIIYVGVKDAKTTTRVMLSMEGLSILLILILSLVILYKVGTTTGLSATPFKSNGNSMSALASTSVFAFLSFIGFESASSLGEETKNPKKYIPLAIGSAVFVTGLFYLLSSYTQVIGFGLDAQGLKALTASTLPLSDLSDKYISNGYGTLLILAACLSCFACALGSVCAGARILFAMSRDGLMYKSMMKVHSKHNTPYVSIFAIMIFAIVLQIAMFKVDGIEVFGYYATIGSLAIIVAYLFTSVAAIVYFKKIKIRTTTNLLIQIVSIVALAFVLLSNVYPVPEYPFNIFPYVILIWIALGSVLCNKFIKDNDEACDVSIESDI